MINFPTLIFDRTVDDLERAAYLKKRVLEVGIDALSEDERQEWQSDLKGFYNHVDLNRVERVCNELSLVLSEQGYPVQISTRLNWTNLDFPTEPEMERIKGNIKRLKDSFFVLTNTPKIPENLKRMDIQKANDIEKILYDLYFIYENLITMSPQIAGFELGGI